MDKLNWYREEASLKKWKQPQQLHHCTIVPIQQDSVSNRLKQATCKIQVTGGLQDATQLHCIYL